MFGADRMHLCKSLRNIVAEVMEFDIDVLSTRVELVCSCHFQCPAVIFKYPAIDS